MLKRRGVHFLVLMSKIISTIFLLKILKKDIIVPQVLRLKCLKINQSEVLMMSQDNSILNLLEIKDPNIQT
ncbi:hypothetical protein, partial [Ligilactobacillus salitolerans]|uniref:hypothetical protein n=1 Tax=Ligilactobacillus salitolerans TaxID=1808352 RepID=UPI001E2F3B90